MADLTVDTEGLPVVVPVSSLLAMSEAEGRTQLTDMGSVVAGLPVLGSLYQLHLALCLWSLWWSWCLTVELSLLLLLLMSPLSDCVPLRRQLGSLLRLSLLQLGVEGVDTDLGPSHKL